MSSELECCANCKHFRHYKADGIVEHTYSNGVKHTVSPTYNECEEGVLQVLDPSKKCALNIYKWEPKEA